MTATRIYRVTEIEDGPAIAVRLVEASSIAQAIRHCADSRYDVTIAKPKDIAELVAKGTKVEQANGAADAE